MQKTEHRCGYMVNVLLKGCHARKQNISVDMVNVLLKDCHAKKYREVWKWGQCVAEGLSCRKQSISVDMGQ